MPASALESLLTMMKRSKNQIELTVRAPTLSLKGVPNKFMNSLMALPNITGLNVSEWNLPLSAQTKLVQMTNLQQLSIRYPEVTLSPLKNLTKLEWRSYEFNYQYQIFTNLHDLHFRYESPVSQIEDFMCLSKLTRLHLECSYNDTSTTVILTTLSKLKDLNISSSEMYRHPRIKLIASCTTLESIYIHVPVVEMDLGWLSLNSRLTQYHVRFDRLDTPEEKFHPLTRLTNIESVRFMNESTARVFKSHQKIKTMHVDYYAGGNLPNVIKNSTILESLHCGLFLAEPALFPNLTKLMCGYCPSAPSSVKVLMSSVHVGNLTQLSKLESWKLSDIGESERIQDFESRYFRHLTRIEFSFRVPKPVRAMLPKLSNLFTHSNTSRLIH